MMLRSLVVFLIILLSISATAQKLPREFRGVWIATVENIDWPSKPGLSTQQQQQEFIDLLDHFKALNFNAIVFQIRPSADAFHLSNQEPWSAYLNGESNQKPSPYYDPLAFMIAETHKRGMEFHAWLNPYRAMVNYQEYHANPYKLLYEKPEWFLNYGKHKYFNPGIPEVRTYTNKIVADIVLHYDIDAIHFDDYFYPYKIAKTPFPDSNTFKTYGGEFYPNRLEDWRRQNVNLIIQELRSTIKSIKPWVQFGISPFGVWRNKAVDPNGSDSEAGQTNYDDLYADILLWLKNGWLDYVVPQVYWHIGFKKADYSKLIPWWTVNNFDTNLYIGHAAYRLNSDKSKSWKKTSPTEIEKQLQFNKSFPEVNGSVFFSAKSFLKNPLNINKKLKNGFYSTPILPPIKGKLLTPEAVQSLKFEKSKGKFLTLSWESIPEHSEKQAVKYLVYHFKKGTAVNWQNSNQIIALTGESSVRIPKKDIKKGDTVGIIPVSRNNHTGKAKYLIR